MSDFLSQIVSSSGVGGSSLPTIKENEYVPPSNKEVIPSGKDLSTSESESEESSLEEESTIEEEVIPSSDSAEEKEESKEELTYEDQEDFFKNKPKVKEVKTQETKTTESQKASNKQEARDYSGFTDLEVSYLKRTSNESFAYLSTELKKAKAAQLRIQELEKTSDIGQFSDPEGYLKSEEYTTASQEFQKSELYLNHWKEQLANIHEAKPWLDLEMDANGKIVTVEKQPTAAAISDLTDRLARTRNYQDSLRSKAESIQKDWTNKAQRLPAFVEAKTKEFFPDYVSKTDDKNYQQMDAVLKQMGQGRNPVASLLKTMYAAHMDLIPKYLAMETKLKTFEEQAKQRQTNVKLGKQVEPSPSNNRKTIKASNNTEFDYEEYLRQQG